MFILLDGNASPRPSPKERELNWGTDWGFALCLTPALSKGEGA
jgi:hypothetical protein